MKQDLYQQVTDQVLHLMQTHGSDWVRPWTGSGIPVNALTQQEYKGSNVLMLGLSAFSQGYETNHWATYKQWQSLDAQVRRGESSTWGIFFKPLTKEDDDGNETTIPMVRAFRVFNSAQVEGWEAPVLENQGEAERIENAELFVSNTGAEIKHGSSGAFYVPTTDKISMPSLESINIQPTDLQMVVRFNEARLFGEGRPTAVSRLNCHKGGGSGPDTLRPCDLPPQASPSHNNVSPHLRQR